MYLTYHPQILCKIFENYLPPFGDLNFKIFGFSKKHVVHSLRKNTWKTGFRFSLSQKNAGSFKILPTLAFFLRKDDPKPST